MRLLVARGANVHAENRFGVQPIGMAERREVGEWEAVVSFLREEMSDISELPPAARALRKVRGAMMVERRHQHQHQQRGSVARGEQEAAADVTARPIHRSSSREAQHSAGDTPTPRIKQRQPFGYRPPPAAEPPPPSPPPSPPPPPPPQDKSFVGGRLGRVYERLSWAGTRQFARAAYRNMTRRNALSLWPYRWSWLLGWIIVNLLVWLSHLATADLVPTTRSDIVTILIGNLMVLVYAVLNRSDADTALSDAERFKNAGSIALRQGRLEAAIEQYKQGEACGAKLSGYWYLNAAFVARGVEVRVACLNNAAICALRQTEWKQAAAFCTRALCFDGVEPLARAKSHFRYAIAQAKLGAVGEGIKALRRAQSLVPEDKEVCGMLRVLEAGERAKEGGREAEEADAAMAVAVAGAAEAGMAEVAPRRRWHERQWRRRRWRRRRRLATVAPPHHTHRRDRSHHRIAGSCALRGRVSSSSAGWWASSARWQRMAATACA